MTKRLTAMLCGGATVFSWWMVDVEPRGYPLGLLLLAAVALTVVTAAWIGVETAMAWGELP